MSLQLLDVAIALCTVFVLLSVFCSGILEWHSQRVGARAMLLREGLLQMVGDDALYRQVVNHPMIAHLGRGSSGAGPAYIPSPIFAVALLDGVVGRAAGIHGEETIKTEALKFDDIRLSIETLANAHFSLGSLLAPMVRRSLTPADLQKQVEDWYDAQSQRIVGWYKAWARWRLFGIGLIVALLLNIDTLAIAVQAAKDPGIRALVPGSVTQAQLGNLQIASASDPATTSDASNRTTTVLTAAKTLGALQAGGLAIGWNVGADSAQSATQIALKVFGLLITALGVSLGAPFWFDLLNKLVNLRGAGTKPPDSGGGGSPAATEGRAVR